MTAPFSIVEPTSDPLSSCIGGPSLYCCGAMIGLYKSLDPQVLRLTLPLSFALEPFMWNASGDHLNHVYCILVKMVLMYPNLIVHSTRAERLSSEAMTSRNFVLLARATYA